MKKTCLLTYYKQIKIKIFNFNQLKQYIKYNILTTHDSFTGCDYKKSDEYVKKLVHNKK